MDREAGSAQHAFQNDKRTAFGGGDGGAAQQIPGEGDGIGGHERRLEALEGRQRPPAARRNDARQQGQGEQRQHAKRREKRRQRIEREDLMLDQPRADIVADRDRDSSRSSVARKPVAAMRVGVASTAASMMASVPTGGRAP